MSRLNKFFVADIERGQIPEDLQRDFFDCLRLKNGVYKTTYARRFDDLNTWMADYLPAIRPLQVLDLAISSGVSTLEWVQALAEAGIDFHMTGTDLTIAGTLVSFGERLHAVLDDTNWPMLFEIDGNWLSGRPRKRDILRYAFSLALIKSALLLWASRYRESKSQETQNILGVSTTTRSINLVIPKLTKHSRVTVREANILSESSLEGTFHVIRAANILNKSYFDNQALTKIVQNLRYHLAIGGILIVCRTDPHQEGLNRATIFELNGRRQFVTKSRLNGGSEIEELVLQL